MAWWVCDMWLQAHYCVEQELAESKAPKVMQVT
jgi:hypothetical protein